MSVLVTGATGFVGRGLVPALAAAGLRVRAAARDPARIAPHAAVEAAPLPDLNGEVDWRALLDGATHVVHLAGLAHAMGDQVEAVYDRVNHRATAALAGAAARAGVPLVFVSSVRAQCGPTSPETVTEDDPPRPTDAYGRSKLAAEATAHAAGGPVTVLRPVLVHGPGVGGNMAALARLAASPWPLPFGALGAPRSLVARDTLVAVIRWALDAPAARGRTFLVADPSPMTLAQLIVAMRAALGRPPGLVALPPALVLGALRLAGRGEMAERLGGALIVSTERLAQAGFVWPAGTDGVAAMMGGYRALPPG